MTAVPTIEAIVAGTHGDPFAHSRRCMQVATGWVARAFIPHAETVAAFTLDGTELGELIPPP